MRYQITRTCDCFIERFVFTQLPIYTDCIVISEYLTRAASHSLTMYFKIKARTSSEALSGSTCIRA
jgi:hypothetical protein